MAICIDCIHRDVCRNAYTLKVEPPNVCGSFKNKADFVEVKHGHWIDDIQKITTVAGVECNGIVGYKCSLCGRHEGSKEPYCNCGAKMDVPDTNDGIKEE